MSADRQEHPSLDRHSDTAGEATAGKTGNDGGLAAGRASHEAVPSARMSGDYRIRQRRTQGWWCHVTFPRTTRKITGMAVTVPFGRHPACCFTESIVALLLLRRTAATESYRRGTNSRDCLYYAMNGLQRPSRERNWVYKTGPQSPTGIILSKVGTLGPP